MKKNIPLLIKTSILIFILAAISGACKHDMPGFKQYFKVSLNTWYRDGINNKAPPLGLSTF